MTRRAGPADQRTPKLPGRPEDIHRAGRARRRRGDDEIREVPCRTVRALAEQAVRAALADAGVTAGQVDMVFFAAGDGREARDQPDPRAG